jgi:hypothetical protein
LAFFCAASLVASNVAAQVAATAPEEEGFFSKLGSAIKKGVVEGTESGVALSGSVRMLGYVNQYSKLQGRELPAYCVASAETGKLLTVVPLFGEPYQRADGSTGFNQMAVPVDKHHDKLELNLGNVLPGLNCADLIASKKLIAYGATRSGAQAPTYNGKAAPEPCPDNRVMLFGGRAVCEDRHMQVSNDQAERIHGLMAAIQACRTTIRNGMRCPPEVVKSIQNAKIGKGLPTLDVTPY